MWAEFWLATFVGFVIIYVPAYAILRTLRFSKIASAGFAPIVAMLFYSLLAIVYAKMGVYTDGWRLFVPLCVVALVVVAVGFLVRRRSGAPAGKGGVSGVGPLLARVFDEQGRMILLYGGMGLVVAGYVFLMSLDTANCTTYAYDDQSHLGVVQSFLERGNYSSLSINYRSYDMGGSDGYYPAVWHLLAASIISICDVENYVGINAVMYLLAALVYPLGCLMAIAKLFPDNKAAKIAGAFFTLTFPAFPWEFFVYGRLVANLLAFCTLPAMFACTFYIVGKREDARTRIAFAILLLGSFVLSAFSQPSVCFSWLYFSIPYVVYVIWTWNPEMPKKRKLLLVIGFCVAVFVFLILCYLLPFLRDVTRWKWAAPITIPDALLDVALQRDQKAPLSIILAVLVACGLIFAVKTRGLRWFVALYVLFACLYILDAGTNLSLKNYAGGWWYTDSHRILAMFAMVSYFVAVLGMGNLVQALAMRLQSKGLKEFVGLGIPALMMIGALLPIITVGQIRVITPMGFMKATISGYYSPVLPDDAVLFSTPEYEFVQKAAEITGDDLVFNIPKDGSAFAYQTSGMKTLTRWSDEGLSGNPSIRILQRSLDDYASSLSVRNAVNEVGVKYVLMLDQGHEPFYAYWEPYSDSNWTGVLNIQEDTPGFELMLSDGDMKLYRILSDEELAAQGYGTGAGVQEPGTAQGASGS